MLFCQEMLGPMKNWDFICKWIFSFYTKAKAAVQTTSHLWIAKNLDPDTLRQDAA